jgi:hypothetical protein
MAAGLGKAIPLLLLAALSAAGVAAAALPDIKGPLGPMEYRAPATPEPQNRRPVRRAVVIVLTVGFAAVGCYYLRRRRARRRTPERRRAGPCLPGQVGDQDAGEFYARLLKAAREALAAAAVEGAAALTPAELAAGSFAPLQRAGRREPELLEKWPELCTRAESAEYARLEVSREQRRADLEYVRRLVRRLAETPAEAEEPDGV